MASAGSEHRMIDACDGCLRRAFLVAHLAPRIAGLLDHPAPRIAGLLALPDDAFVAAAAGDDRDGAWAFLDGFEVEWAREALASFEVVALCRHADEYPAPIQELADPPAVLFGLGAVDALRALRVDPAVTVVGSRRASPYGTEVAYALGRGLGAAGVPVVSGLAVGIDGTAHRGCLDGSGVTVAVLACGPDVVYPRRHRRLYERIRAEGIVLSELPPGTRPFRWSFPARNRIMAALARMTVVVEAAEPSGSLITADFARDLGRAVAAVPGRVTSSIARGTNGLLRDGAVPVTATEDVLDELFGVGVRRPLPVAEARREPTDSHQRAVLEAAERFSSVDAIARELHLTASDVRATLGRLEGEGWLVRRDLGGWERAAI
jgi:DNA processing protein